MKKKGSALILVLCIMGILSIMSILILGVTANDNKLRNKESKHSASFYGADLGIDASYTVLKSEIDKALENGKSRANEYSRNWRCTEYYNIHTKECEEEKQKRIKEAFKRGYVDFLKDNIKKDLEFSTQSYDNKNYDFLKDKINGDLIIEANPTFKYVYDGEKLESLEVISTYSKDKNSKRSVKKVYEFLSPNICDNKNAPKRVDIDKLLNYASAADGKITINNKASLAFHGDIWSGGLKSSNDIDKDRNFKIINIDKADTTIHGKFSSAADVEVEGGNLNISSNIEESNKGDMYLNNIYLKNKCKLNVGGNLYFFNNIYMRNDDSNSNSNSNSDNNSNSNFGSEVEIKGDLCGINNIEDGDFTKKRNGVIFNPIEDNCFKQIDSIGTRVFMDRKSYDCCQKCKDSLGKIKIDGDLILEGTPYTKNNIESVEPFLFYNWSSVYNDTNKSYYEKEKALAHLINYNYDGCYLFSDPYKKIYNDSIDVLGKSYIKGIGIENDKFITDTIKDYDREKLTEMEKKFSKEVFGLSQEESLQMLSKKQIFHSIDKSINWDGVKDYIKSKGRNDYYCDEIKNIEKGNKERFYIIYNISGENIALKEGKCYLDNKMILNIKNDKKKRVFIISNGDIEYNSEYNNSEDYIFLSTKDITLNINHPTNFGNYDGFKNTLKYYFLNYNIPLYNKIFGVVEADEKIDSPSKIIKKSTWSIVK